MAAISTSAVKIQTLMVLPLHGVSAARQLTVSSQFLKCGRLELWQIKGGGLQKGL